MIISSVSLHVVGPFNIVLDLFPQGNTFLFVLLHALMSGMDQHEDVFKGCMRCSSDEIIDEAVSIFVIRVENRGSA